MVEHHLGSEVRPLRLAVVGSGPSGFYILDSLFKVQHLHFAADVFDRLPTPFGLVRGGVAPDHQKIKSVTRVFDRIAAKPGFRFFGNVEIGRDLQIDELKQFYDQIVFAVGNESDRRLGIPGEDLDGVHSATEFVFWYNSHPDFVDRSFDLARASRAAVIGNGNVAMDVARVLMRRPDELAETDIFENALFALRSSSLREVLLLGRRSPAEAAFSPNEIKEIADLEGCDVVVDKAAMELGEVSKRWLATKAQHSAARTVHFLTAQSKKGEGNAEKKIRCRFLVSPVEFLGDEGGRVRAVRLQHAELYEDEQGVPRAREIDRYETVNVQLVFKAIGYRGVPIPGVPFDSGRGIFPNLDGRMIDPLTTEPVPNQYVVGWAKRGPTGRIGTNGPDSQATLGVMLRDLRDQTTCKELGEGWREQIVSHMRDKNIEFVSFDDWKMLNAYEVQAGMERGKIRHKTTSVDEMLEAIRASKGEYEPSHGTLLRKSKTDLTDDGS